MSDKQKKFTGAMKEFDSEKGTASVVFATLETIDFDGDWIQKGAFQNTGVVKVCGSHDWKGPTIGVAKIREAGNEAIADIDFNLDMATAKDWHSSIKFNFAHGAPQEFSFGFDVDDSEFATRSGKKVRVLKKLDTFEVSPVLRGAGINTRVLEVKGYSPLRGTWESIQESLRVAAHGLLLGDRDGWVSIDGTYPGSVIVCVYEFDGEMQHYEFDWSINGDGTVTLSNQRTVDLQTVVVEKNLKLSELFARTLGDISLFTHRSKALAALRVKEGRTLSRANRERLGRLVTELSTLLAETDKQPEAEGQEEATVDEGKTLNLDGLELEFLELEARLDGVLA